MNRRRLFPPLRSFGPAVLPRPPRPRVHGGRPAKGVKKVLGEKTCGAVCPDEINFRWSDSLYSYYRIERRGFTATRLILLGLYTCVGYVYYCRIGG